MAYLFSLFVYIEHFRDNLEVAISKVVIKARTEAILWHDFSDYLAKQSDVCL